MNRKSVAIILLLVVVLGLFFARVASFNNGVLKPELPLGDKDKSNNVDKPQGSETNDLTWKTFNDDRYNFTFDYPSDAEAAVDLAIGVRVLKIGKTQPLGTEMVDGYIVTINNSKYSGNFRDFVEAQRQNDITSNPAGEGTDSVSPITEGSLIRKDLKAYTYVVKGLGEFEMSYVALNNTDYLKITKLVSDPDNNGYQKEIESILNTLTTK
jgi:hypothetical protein